MRKSLISTVFFIITLLFLIFFTTAQTIQTGNREITNQGSNFETTCQGSECATTIYSYDKYFNRNGAWEEIDESWHSCAEGFCTNSYYFQAIANPTGLVSMQRGNMDFRQQITTFANSNLTISNPIIQNNLLIYQNILPNIDLRYQYLPHKLKEEIIINQRLINLDQENLEINFTVSDFRGFNLEKPFICDSNRKCRPINYTLTNNQVTIIIPNRFLTNETTVYPVIIDPSFSISNSSIIWNGRVEYDFMSDSAPNYYRISNPSSLELGATESGAALGDIDWNLANIPNLNINNATLRLFIETLTPPNFINITQIEKNSSQWADDFNGNQNFYNDIDNGTSYSYAYSPIPGQNFSYDFNFNQQGLNSINSAFQSSKRFSTGLSTNWSNKITISARDNTNASRRPVLVIQHTKEDYTLTYDANGNMIQGFGKYMEYDGWNRLSKIRNTNATGRLLAEYF